MLQSELKLIVQPPAEFKTTLQVGQGPAGKPAPVVSAGGISLDPGNSITNGTDGGLYAPDDIPTDPLAYYILARS